MGCVHSSSLFPKEESEKSVNLRKDSLMDYIRRDSYIIVNTESNRKFKPHYNRHLIVDDVDSNRMILESYLKRIGVECDHAVNGFDAVYNVNRTSYDIIWMDLRMPKMDGFECTEKIKSIGFKGFVIVVTGDVSQYSMNRCKKAGVDQILLKPILYEKLMRLSPIQAYVSIKKENIDVQ